MEVIEAARALGRAIQADERYLAFTEANKPSEEDIVLQGMLGKLSLLQMSYQNESEKPSPDQARLEELDKDFRDTYGEVMLHPAMREYEDKKQAVDDLMNYVIKLLTLCVNGEDPDPAEPVTNEGGGCSGSCSTCGGCG